MDAATVRRLRRSASTAWLPSSPDPDAAFVARSAMSASACAWLTVGSVGAGIWALRADLYGDLHALGSHCRLPSAGGQHCGASGSAGAPSPSLCAVLTPGRLRGLWVGRLHRRIAQHVAACRRPASAEVGPPAPRRPSSRAPPRAAGLHGIHARRTNRAASIACTPHCAQQVASRAERRRPPSFAAAACEPPPCRVPAVCGEVVGAPSRCPAIDYNERP